MDGARTPFVKAGGEFRDLHPDELGQRAFKELLCRYPFLKEETQEVIVGNVGNPSESANIARVLALRSGLPESLSAFTVHRNCASALESVTSAATRIQAGLSECILAGGVESMSSYPLLFSKKLVQVFSHIFQSKTLPQKLKALLKIRLQYLKPRIALLEGLTDPFSGLSMGETAEVLAKEFNIDRKEQDGFALKSHQKALKAKAKLKEEISPMITDKDFIEEDRGPREDQSLEKLAKLKPYFDRCCGTVTVGNACPITDGAVCLVLMNASKAESLGLKPLVKVRSFAYAGCPPRRMGLGPVFAIPKALKKAGLKLKDMDLIEINEAFSAQVLACMRASESPKFCAENLGLGEALGPIDPEKLNVNGGAVALGHPVGATGSRLVLTLMKEMKRRGAAFGLASLCIGGGQGGALVLESV